MMATPHTVARPSFTATARQILAEGGYRGFFRGLGPTLLRAFQVNASALWVYEGLMRLLGAEKVRLYVLKVSPERANHNVRLDTRVSSTTRVTMHTLLSPNI